LGPKSTGQKLVLLDVLNYIGVFVFSIVSNI